MSDIVCCKDCVYSAQSNLAGNFAELSNLVYCTYYKNNISIIRGCSNGKPKLKTNADRFRAMTDEELAEWLETKVWDLPWCNDDTPVDDETKICSKWDCVKCALEWLKQEADT